MVRLLLALMLVWMLGASPASAQADGAGPNVRIIATRFTLPAKYAALAEWAQAEGYRLDWRYAEEAQDAAALVDGADLLVLDGPRPNDMAAIDEALGGIGPGGIGPGGIGDVLPVPWIAVGGGPPRSGGIEAGPARRLIGYYAGGGATNLRGFVRAARRLLAGEALDDLPPPVALNATGVYHPESGNSRQQGVRLANRGGVLHRSTNVFPASCGCRRRTGRSGVYLHPGSVLRRGWAHMVRRRPAHPPCGSSCKGNRQYLPEKSALSGR